MVAWEVLNLANAMAVGFFGWAIPASYLPLGTGAACGFVIGAILGRWTWRKKPR